MVHGRRKAPATTATMPVQKWGQNAGIALGAAALILSVALPAAQAERPITETRTTGSDRAASVDGSVTAASGAQIDFSRSDITSASAPGLGGPAQTGTTPAETALAGSGASAAVPDTGSKTEGAGGAPSAPTTTNSLTAPLSSLSVASPFGYRTSPITGAAGEMHTGIDYAGACNTPVLSAGPGVVVEAGFSPYGGGNRIVVDHGNGLKSTYNHLAVIGVSVGQQVARGQQIAGVGTTGASTGCHLHFEVMVNGQIVNPGAWI